MLATSGRSYPPVLKDLTNAACRPSLRRRFFVFLTAKLRPTVDFVLCTRTWPRDALHWYLMQGGNWRAGQKKQKKCQDKTRGMQGLGRASKSWFYPRGSAFPFANTLNDLFYGVLNSPGPARTWDLEMVVI